MTAATPSPRAPEGPPREGAMDVAASWRDADGDIGDIARFALAQTDELTALRAQLADRDAHVALLLDERDERDVEHSRVIEKLSAAAQREGRLREVLVVTLRWLHRVKDYEGRSCDDPAVQSHIDHIEHALQATSTTGET